MEVILSRRSIRKYRKKSISEKILQEILDAGFHAPSAGNQRPWHFIIVDDRTILESVQSFHPSAAMLQEADKAILVCGDPHLEKFQGYWMIDCSAATENMLLAAHAKGLGACWLGLYPRADRVAGVRRLFALPDHIMPLALISLGYPAEEKPRDQRYDTSRIHRNSW